MKIYYYNERRSLIFETSKTIAKKFKFSSHITHRSINSHSLSLGGAKLSYDVTKGVVRRGCRFSRFLLFSSLVFHWAIAKSVYCVSMMKFTNKNASFNFFFVFFFDAALFLFSVVCRRLIFYLLLRSLHWKNDSYNTDVKKCFYLYKSLSFGKYSNLNNFLKHDFTKKTSYTSKVKPFSSFLTLESVNGVN